MRLSDLDQSNFNYLELQDFENILNINYVDNKYYLYDLNSTLYISGNTEEIENFVLKTDAHWPLISYLIYGTTRLWWLLCKLNNANINDIFEVKEVGTIIKFLPKGSLQKILDLINK